MGKLKNMRKTKLAKVLELRVQVTVEPRTQHQYAAPYQKTAFHNPSPQSETPETAFYHMQTVQVKSLTKQADNRYIQPLWLSTQPDAQVHQFDCGDDSEAGCNIMPLYIYRSLFRDKKPVSHCFHQ